MLRALALAERGWGQTAPNPMVGAVVVNEGRVVGEGWHPAFGAPHAEVLALTEAGDLASGATLYVTLEPCNHWGKTPPCADAVVRHGVGRVVIAALDPGAESGGGAERLRRHGIEVSTGVCESEARELNAAFFNAFSSDRPWVVLKLATSIDGAIADATRSPGWLTGAAALREVHRLRANTDAIAVGAGTFLSDAPRLTVRGDVMPRVAPLRVVFDRQRRVAAAPDAREAPDAPEGSGSGPFTHEDVIVVAEPDVRAALRQLRARGIRSLLVEGGAGLASDLLDAGVVDRLVIFQAPIILGRGALHAFSEASPQTVSGARRLRVVSRRQFGADWMTTYAPNEGLDVHGTG